MTDEILMFILRVKCSCTKKLKEDLFGRVKTLSIKTVRRMCFGVIKFWGRKPGCLAILI